MTIMHPPHRRDVINGVGVTIMHPPHRRDVINGVVGGGGDT